MHVQALFIQCLLLSVSVSFGALRQLIVEPSFNAYYCSSVLVQLLTVLSLQVMPYSL